MMAKHGRNPVTPPGQCLTKVLITMTDLQKAQAFFRMNGVGAAIDEVYLYIEAHGFEVQVSQAEIELRAELYDEQFSDINQNK